MCITINSICGILAADFRDGDGAEILDAYQRLALALNGAQEVIGLFLRTGDEEPELHYALLDVMRTMAFVLGGPLKARAAVVGQPGGVAEVCRSMLKSMRLAGCELRFFNTERLALAWLVSSSPASAAGRSMRLGEAHESLSPRPAVLSRGDERMCGMNQPTYSPVQATLFFPLQDLDATSPAGPVRIRAETIAHYPRKHAHEIVEKKLAAIPARCPHGSRR